MHISGASEPSRAPERSRRATRRRLVRAGVELFGERGLHRTTSAQIARAAGVAAGTFYLHFPDKRALFQEIVFEALSRLSDRLTGARRRAGDDPAIWVRASAQELLAFADEHRDLVRILFGHDPEARELGDAVLAELLPGVEARLRDRLVAGADPAVAAQAIVGMWVRVLAWWLEDPRRAPREALLETMVRLHPLAGAPAP